MKLIDKENGVLGIYLLEYNTEKYKQARLLSSVICFAIAIAFIVFLFFNRNNLTPPHINWSYLLIGTWVVMAYVRVTEYINIDFIAGFVDKEKIEAYLKEQNVAIPEAKTLTTDFNVLMPTLPFGLSIIYILVVSFAD